MKYIFTPTGLQILEALSFTKTLYAFDFDGTLSPIVGTPDAATMPSITKESIYELSRKAPVAIVSGRSINDLKRYFKNFEGYLIGNHGLEGISSNKDSTHSAERLCQTWKSQLEQEWKDLKSDNGIFIEDKVYSLALHYRRSRNKKIARLSLLKKIEKLDPLPRVILGKSVINLVPVGGPHKGVALLETMKKLNVKCAFYIGDDDTDEDIFSLPNSSIISIRVGQKKSSNAQFFLKRQSEINSLVKVLAKQAQT